MGDSVWTRTYQKIDTQSAQILNIIPLPDGRIVLGAQSTYNAFTPQPAYDEYYHHTPWFIVIDSLGNILKDTLYGDEYIVGSNLCNSLYADKNGGYIHFGVHNQLVSIYANDFRNFPAYVAHLDTNFRITWITNFPYTVEDGHQQAYTMRQLRDSSYMLMGEDDIHEGPTTQGFAAHIGRDGSIIWHHHYKSDPAHFAYLTDMVEKPDGSFLFVGQTFNDTCAAWKGNGDVWLLGLDSNGCENPYCAPTAVKGEPKKSSCFSLFPNPTNGAITVTTTVGGTLEVYTMIGQHVGSYRLDGGKAEIELPPSLVSGIYTGVFTPSDGSAQSKARIVYQP